MPYTKTSDGTKMSMESVHILLSTIVPRDNGTTEIRFYSRKDGAVMIHMISNNKLSEEFTIALPRNGTGERTVIDSRRTYDRAIARDVWNRFVELGFHRDVR
jgi:hypothetical protein